MRKIPLKKSSPVFGTSNSTRIYIKYIVCHTQPQSKTVMKEMNTLSGNSPSPEIHLCLIPISFPGEKPSIYYKADYNTLEE